MDKILFDRDVNLALSASAGTGKTRTLSLRFLDLYLKYQNLASIYALTFTNKASQEMRERVIHYLSLLANPKELTEEEKEIVRIFGSRFKNITEKARFLKHQLLCNFTDFNVSTIHSFLNSILKTIPFQTNVLPDFRIIEETEENILVDKVLDDFLNDAMNNTALKILVNRVLDIKDTDVKNTIKTLFLSLLPRMPEIMEISALNPCPLRSRRESNLGSGFESFKDSFTEEKLSKSFYSFKLNCLEMINLLKNQPAYKNKNLVNKIDKIEEFLKHGEREKSIEEIIDLFNKNYFKELKEEQTLGSKLKNLTESATKQAKEYTFLYNRKLLLDNLKLLFTIYEKFQDAKTDMNVVTFNDLETYSLKALSNNKMKEYLYFKSSSQIEHLLIDEFQDTSIIQWKILEPIIEEITSGDNHSFFYVGDPNQAIYRFRGGDSRLFNHIKNKFHGKIQTEYLTENYRSKEEIVSFVNSVFASQTEYKPMKSIPKEGGWVIVEDLGEYKQKEGAEVIQSRIVEIIKDLRQKGYNYSDMALLVRRNGTGIKLSEVLEEAGIPIKSESRASLSYQEGIQNMTNLLLWLTNPFKDFHLYLTLLSPLFSFGEKRIENLNREKKDTCLFELLRNKHPNWPVTKKLQKILTVSDLLRPYELLSFIYSELKVIERYKYAEPFLSLLESAYKFENEKGTSLPSFIEYLKQYGSAIEFKGSEMNGVQILTCHKAKGLEFPIVLLPETVWNMEGKENDQFVFEYSEPSSCVQGLGETEHELKLSDVYYRKGPLLKLFKKEIFLDEKKRTFKDELNNLYVAMTRAREGLWIVGYKNIRLSKPVRDKLLNRFRNQRNQFPNVSNTWFDFITEPIKLKMKDGVYTLGEIKNYEKLQKKNRTHLIKLTPHVRSIGGGTKEKKVHTPTPARPHCFALRSKTVGAGGEESMILSDEGRDALRWGEVCHYALSKIERADKKNIEKIINSSINATKRRYARSKKEQKEIAERLYPLLRDILTDKDLEFIFYVDSKVKVRIEVPIYFKRDGTEISGRIDRLLIRDGSVEIVDYKKGERSTCSAGRDKKYIKQMGDYRTGASKICPKKEIKGYFLWLDNPKGERIERVFQ